MKFTYYRFYLIIVLLFMSNPLLAQNNIGLPIIKNYPKEVYNGGLQTWEIQQDKYGRLYFANNEGLLVFDGENWQNIQVANKTIVRSLLIDDERIYVGSQGDFGYFEPNKKGVLTYFSLKGLIDKPHRNFADVWDITKNNKEIIFRTNNKIYTFKDNVRVFTSGSKYEFLGKVNGTIYLHSSLNGLTQIVNKKIKPLKNTILFNDKVITGIIPFNDTSIIISTLKNGFFNYDGKQVNKWEIDPIIEQNRINCIAKIDAERIAVGTLSGGLFILDFSGKVLQHIDIQNGLASNDVLNISTDGLGNLWLALTNGIDYIEINSPFSIIKPDGDLSGIGYDVKIHNNQIYFGTSNGLYVTDWKSYYNPFEGNQFQLVNNTKGQVWSLNIRKDDLLMGHHEGTFRVENKQVTPLSNLPGTWTSVVLQDNGKHLLEGNYNGLNLYQFESGHWRFQQKIGNMIDESCRIIAQDSKDNIWVAHPYRGVYKIQLDVEKRRAKSVRLYGSNNGFPTNYVHVFKIGDAVVFTTEQGVYEYNEQKDNFELSKEWSTIIDSTSRVQRLFEDKDENIWFVIDDEVGVFWSKDLGVDKQLKKQTFPQLKGRLVGGFEQIYLYDDENVFFPLERGFMHFNPKKYNSEDSLFFTHLQQVVLNNSGIVYGGYKTNSWERSTFKSNENSFTFHYAATDFSNLKHTMYQFKLEGLNDDWSPWTEVITKEYTNLPPDTYAFKVRAKNANGQISEIQSFEFKISPPWYASTLAKIIYTLMGLGLLFSLIFFPHRQYKHEKAILVEEQEKTLQEQSVEHQKIVAKNEAEISQLQQEKMQTEINFKNQELATTTMHLVQKGEFLLRLKEELNKILNNTNEPKIKKDIRKTIKLLNENAELDKEWEQFAQYFDQVHEDYLKRLRETYPQLTPKDQRLCTYLKMNLSTKEIAPLMNISVRGVEISRYRLRKKMELSTETNLNEFMMNF